MKNVHVLPTEKPSILYAKDDNYKLANSTMAMDWYISSAGYKPYNICITSDEEIKEGDYWINLKYKDVDKCTHNAEVLTFNSENYQHVKKIILTTDQDLIKDGVQAIDDEFLEWFVKNPSCEEVEVEEVYFHGSGYYDANQLSEQEKKLYSYFKEYKIIIPKEDEEVGFMSKELDIEKERSLKQETLEEAAERYSAYSLSKVGFIEGAKWQQEQDKQEIQDLKNRLDIIRESSNNLINMIEQFKNK
jgi:hypothetical protein